MSSSQQPTTTTTTIEELRARRQAEKEEREQRQREEDEAFKEELRRLAEEEEKRKREEEERRRRLEKAEQDWLRKQELEKARKEKRKAVEILEETGDEAEPSGSNKKVSNSFQKKGKLLIIAFTDKDKISRNQEFTALRVVHKGGGGMPQESNRSGLQTVCREEGGVQPGGAAKEDRKEGGEGRGEVADAVRARS